MSRLQRRDIVYIKILENYKVLGRITGFAHNYNSYVPYNIFDLYDDKIFTDEIKPFYDNQIIRNFGQITNKELEEQYPEYII